MHQVAGLDGTVGRTGVSGGLLTRPGGHDRVAFQRPGRRQVLGPHPLVEEPGQLPLGYPRTDLRPNLVQQRLGPGNGLANGVHLGRRLPAAQTGQEPFGGDHALGANPGLGQDLVQHELHPMAQPVGGGVIAGNAL